CKVLPFIPQAASFLQFDRFHGSRALLYTHIPIVRALRSCPVHQKARELYHFVICHPYRSVRRGFTQGFYSLRTVDSIWHLVHDTGTSHGSAGLAWFFIRFIFRPFAIRWCPVRIPIDLMDFKLSLRCRMSFLTDSYRIPLKSVSTFHNEKLPFGNTEDQMCFFGLRFGIRRFFFRCPLPA